MTEANLIRAMKVGALWGRQHILSSRPKWRDRAPSAARRRGPFALPGGLGHAEIRAYAPRTGRDPSTALGMTDMYYVLFSSNVAGPKDRVNV